MACVLEAGADANAAVAGRVRKALQFKGMLLVQYVKGMALDEALHTPDLPLHRKTFESIGRLMALDVVLNNTDRLPMAGLWAHDGNLGNVMVQRMIVGPPRVVAIDSVVTEIRHADKRAAYVATVRALAADLRALAPGASGELLPCFGPLARLLPDRAALLHVQSGFVGALSSLAADNAVVQEAFGNIRSVSGSPYWMNNEAAKVRRCVEGLLK